MDEDLVKRAQKAVGEDPWLDSPERIARAILRVLDVWWEDKENARRARLDELKKRSEGASLDPEELAKRTARGGPE